VHIDNVLVVFPLITAFRGDTSTACVELLKMSPFTTLLSDDEGDQVTQR
jgi:hypothetical protein